MWALRELGIPKSTVIAFLSDLATPKSIRAWWNAPYRPWRDDEASTSKKSPGRPRVLTDDQAEELGRQLKSHKTLRMLAASTKWPKSTIHDAVRQNDFISYRPNKVPALTKVHVEKRLTYAKKYIRKS